MAIIRVKFLARFVFGVSQTGTLETDFPGIDTFTAQLPAKLATIRQYVPELTNLVPLPNEPDAFLGDLEFDDQSKVGKFIAKANVGGSWDFPIEPDPAPAELDPTHVPWRVVRMITDRIFSIPVASGGNDLWQGITGIYKLDVDEASEFQPGGGVGSGGYGGVK